MVPELRSRLHQCARDTRLHTLARNNGCTGDGARTCGSPQGPQKRMPRARNNGSPVPDKNGSTNDLAAEGPATATRRIAARMENLAELGAGADVYEKIKSLTIGQREGVLGRGLGERSDVETREEPLGRLASTNLGLSCGEGSAARPCNRR